jgi:23S rRNA (uridine2552-2'-O)-methyltransferase
MSKSSRRWLKEHFSDPYVKKAQQEGYRSRAVYKLIEIEERDHLFKPGMIVVDLGAAPGGWSQWVVKAVGSKGRVVAIDILPMDALPGLEIIEGDFMEETTLQHISHHVGAHHVDWVISDMAPNLSGIESADQARSIALIEAALLFAQEVLNAEGGLLVKAFQGEGFDAFLREVKRCFTSVAIRKPKASRSRSSEVYILAKRLKK